MVKKKPSSFDVSLFPFLSVLCALVGVFTLFLLLTMSARVMESADAAVAPQSATPGATSSTESGASGLSVAEHERLQAEIDRLSATLAKRRNEYNELARLQSELMELLTAKQRMVAGGKAAVLGRGLELEPKEDVELVPDPNVVMDKTPRFLEVTALEFVLQPERQRFPATDLRRNDSGLQAFLHELDRNRESQYLLLLIHPDGADKFQDIYRYLQQAFPSNTGDLPSRIDIGFEPYSKGWELVSRKLANPNWE